LRRRGGRVNSASVDDVELGKAVIAAGLLSQERVRQVWSALGPGETLAQALLNRRLVSAEELRRLTGAPSDLQTRWDTGSSSPASVAVDDSQVTRIDRAGGLPQRDSSHEAPASAHGTASVRRRKGALPEVGEVVVGRFRIEAELGRGGMGAVYKAHDSQRGGAVALKLILPELASEDVLARFAREARLAAQVDKRGGIVRVYEFGVWEGTPYCSMELVEGEDLEKLFAREQIAWERLARLLEGVSRSVAACHDAGIIHRDLKPANILVGANEETKIADFGLARDDESNQEHLTRTGDLLGTPAYMAPEQADDAKGVDGRADVYALGSILYRGLAGKPAFTGPAHQVLNRLLFRDPVAPSKVNTGVPRDLEAICLKAMAKAPEHRYATAVELADDLGRFVAGELVRARTVSATTRFRRRYSRREPRAVAAVRAVQGMVLLTGVACVAFAVLVWAPGVVEAQARWATVTLDPVELGVRGQVLDVSESELVDRRAALERVQFILINDEVSFSARQLVARLLAHSRLGKLQRSEPMRVPTRFDRGRGAEDVVIDARVDLAEGQGARALRRLDALLSVGDSAEVNAGARTDYRLARLMRLRVLADLGAPGAALNAAAALLEGEPDDALRAFVVEHSKTALRRVYLKALRDAPTVKRGATEDALRSCVRSAEALGVGLSWLAADKVAVLEETAPEWRKRMQSAVAQLGQRQLVKADALTAHLGAIVRGVEPVVLPGPELKRVGVDLLKGALAAFNTELSVRVTSRNDWDRGLAKAALKIESDLFYRFDPRGTDLRDFYGLLELWFVKWPDAISVEYLLAILRTGAESRLAVPSSSDLIDMIDRTRDKSELLRRLDELDEEAHMARLSRARAFVRLLVRLQLKEHKAVGHDTAEEARAARVSLIRAAEALVREDTWTLDLANHYVGDAYFFLSKILNAKVMGGDGSSEEAKEWSKRAAKEARRARALVTRAHVWETYEEEANSLMALGDDVGVQVLWSVAVAEVRSALGRTPDAEFEAELAGSLHKLADAWRTLGADAKARQCAAEALKRSGRTTRTGLRIRCFDSYLKLKAYLVDPGAFEPLRAHDLESHEFVDMLVRAKLALGDAEEARKYAEHGLKAFPKRARQFQRLLEQTKQ
jgi:hypothetical protein